MAVGRWAFSPPAGWATDCSTGASPTGCASPGSGWPQPAPCPATTSVGWMLRNDPRSWFVSDPGRRERVVYIPGIDGTGRLLFRQPRLHAEYDVRCISHPQDCAHTYADLVANSAKPLEESGGGIVLAESFGGAVALMLALQRPELVRRLVLVNTFA